MSQGPQLKPGPMPAQVKDGAVEAAEDSAELVATGGEATAPGAEAGKKAPMVQITVVFGGDELEDVANAVMQNRKKLEETIDSHKAGQATQVARAGQLVRLEQQADREKYDAVRKADEAKGGGFWKKLRSLFTQEIQREQAAAKRAQAIAEQTKAAVLEASAQQQRAAHLESAVAQKAKQAVTDQKKNKDRYADVVKNIDEARSKMVSFGKNSGS